MSVRYLTDPAPQSLENDAPPRALVRLPSREDRAYASCVVEIARRRRELASRQLGLASVKLELSRFVDGVLSRATQLLAELDQVRRAIHEHERRLAWLRADVDPDASPGDRDPDDDSDRARTDWRDAEHGESGGHGAHQRPPARPLLRPRLDAATDARVKQLYRALARRYHPDLAPSDDERRSRELVMLRVNDAFQRRDLSALLALWRETAPHLTDLDGFGASPIAVRLDVARREIAHLGQTLSALEADLVVLKMGETYRLWQRHQAGELVAKIVEAEIGRELAKRRRRLTTLTVAYHRAQWRKRRAGAGPLGGSASRAAHSDPTSSSAASDR